MMNNQPKKKINKSFIFGIIAGVFIINSIFPNAIFAMPWDGPLEELRSSITGKAAKSICAITVCITGVMIGMGEGGAAGRKALQLICGLALAIGFMQILDMFS